MTTTARPFFVSEAEEAGYDAGLAVLAGTLDVEAVGAQWVEWADRSYGSGVAFERGFERTGAES